MAWKDKEFLFGAKLKLAPRDPNDNDEPGDTVAEHGDGRPRSLDFTRYDRVDFSINDEVEDYS